MKNSFVFIFLFFVTNARAQQPGGIDTLLPKIAAAANDTIIARLYKQIAEQTINNNPAVALKYANIGLAHVTAMKWPKGIAVFSDLHARIDSDRGDYAAAIQRYTYSYQIHNSNKDLFNAATSLNNRGSAYQRQSNFEQAAKDYFAALQLAEQIPDAVLTAMCLNNISLVYAGQNNLKKSLEYQMKAIVLQKKAGDFAGMAASFSSLGNTYLLQHDSLQATTYHLAALRLFTLLEDYMGMASVYTNLYLPSQSPAQKLSFKLKAQQIWDSINPAHSISIVNLGNLAIEYLAMAKDAGHEKYPGRNNFPGNKTLWLQTSRAYLKRAMDYSIANGDRGNYIFLKGISAELEAANGAYKNAYEDASQYHLLYDSTYSQDNKNIIAGIEGQRELAVKDKEIALNKQAAIAQQKQLIAVLAVTGLLGIIGFLLYRQGSLRKRSNEKLLVLNSQLDEANKAKAKFLAIMSHDLRSPLAKLVNFMHLQKSAPDLLDPAKIAAQQEKITTSAASLLQNMETLLLWSKGQMDHFAPEKKQVAVSNLFSYIEQSFVYTDNVNISFSNPQNLLLSTDENYVQTIMHNLTANAVKALAGQEKAALKWNACREQDKIILSISDNGPGMEEAYLYNLLHENKQANSKTGFGLHLIFDLAKAINCDIQVEMKKGEGTVFNCVFEDQ